MIWQNRLARRLAVAGIAAGITSALNKEQARAAERRHPPVGSFTAIDGVRLHYTDRGRGPAVVFLHGNGAMIQEVEATGLPQLVAHGGQRAIVPDRPGFGYSSRPSGVRWTPERQAMLLADLIKEIDAAPAVVVGHSWGALVAAAMAIVRPDVVRGLVLVSGLYFPVPASNLLLGVLAAPVIGDALRYSIGPLASGLAAPGFIARAFEPNSPTPAFQEEYPVELAVRPGQLRAVGEEASMMRSATERLQHRYREIACPTAVLAGSGDRILDPLQQSVRLARGIAGAELEMISTAGHMVPHVEPLKVLRAINRIAERARPSIETESSVAEPNGATRPN